MSLKTVIMINVGTPRSPEPEDVGTYLREFLMDENILQVPRPFRDFLVKVLIVPRRRRPSSIKYKKIWTEQGSPLMTISLRQQQKLQQALGAQWKVILAMQVGEPRLVQAVEQAQGDIFLLPLYPQFAMATAGGALKAAQKILGSRPAPSLPPFFDQPWFIQAQAQKIRERRRPQGHLLLSYHGLPIRHLQKQNAQCLRSVSCCQQLGACERNCYRAQCLRTSELLQQELGLPEVSIGFQSRLGRAQWMEPSTQAVAVELAKKGVRHLQVACPSFVSDCLETLEEVGIEIRDTFLQAGGESFELIDCVNDSDLFIRGLKQALLKL